MKKCVSRKLRSENGASITYALLLFLVCAVVGTIVLTAGTVASGRLADKAKMDQRYYRIVSAVDFLKDEFDGQKIIVTRTKEGDTYSLSYGDPEVVYDPDAGLPETTDFLTVRTLGLLDSLSGSNMWDSDFYKQKVMNGEDEAFDTYNLQFIGGETINIGVKTYVRNGMLEMYFDDSGDTQDYILKMTVAPSVSEVESVSEDKTSKRATITWIAGDVEKVFSAGE